MITLPVSAEPTTFVALIRNDTLTFSTKFFVSFTESEVPIAVYGSVFEEPFTIINVLLMIG